MNLRATDLQRQLRIDTLPQWCDGVEEVLSCKGDKGRVRSVFGEQPVHREMIGAGVRFSLPLSGHALQWALTADAARPGTVLVHSTTNRRKHDAAWIATLERSASRRRVRAEFQRFRLSPESSA